MPDSCPHRGCVFVLPASPPPTPSEMATSLIFKVLTQSPLWQVQLCLYFEPPCFFMLRPVVLTMVPPLYSVFSVSPCHVATQFLLEVALRSWGRGLQHTPEQVTGAMVALFKAVNRCVFRGEWVPGSKEYSKKKGCTTLQAEPPPRGAETHTHGQKTEQHIANGGLETSQRALTERGGQGLIPVDSKVKLDCPLRSQLEGTPGGIPEDRTHVLCPTQCHKQ